MVALRRRGRGLRLFGRMSILGRRLGLAVVLLGGWGMVGCRKWGVSRGEESDGGRGVRTRVAMLLLMPLLW